MIRSFRCKEAEKIFKREFSKKLPEDIQRATYKKLIMLDEARTLKDLALLPNNRLEALSKDRKGQHSIRINDQWRICFVWDNGDVYAVEIVDYH